MSAVTAEITIDAPPARVFATIMDPQRLGDWVTIHRSVKVRSPDPTAPGAQMDQVLALRGVPFTVHWTLTSVSVPHEAEWQGKGPAGSQAFIRYRLTGEDAGPTTLEYTNDFSTPGGPLGYRASKLVVGGVSEREANHSLAKLKSLMES
jgi:uncharacterized protein YndB with AHSA1/START domain